MVANIKNFEFMILGMHPFNKEYWFMIC